MIPKIIHQTSRTTDIPLQWRAYQATARTLHPGWDYHHWTDEENRLLVQRQAPGRLALYDSLPLAVMRADMIRYIYMHASGGLYFDFDFEFVKPFDLLDARLVVPRQNDDGEAVSLGNAVLASEPGHPFWNEVLDELETGIRGLGRTPLEDDVVSLTGPGLVTRAYERHPYPELRYGRREEFNPAFFSPEERAALVNAGRTYGIHHTDGSWRARTLAQRARRKLALLRSRLRKP